MNGFMKRMERVREALEGPQTPMVTLIWESGERRSMPLLEAVEAISTTPGIEEAEANDPTAQSLLNAMLPSGQDLSDIPELVEQMEGEKAE